MQMSINTAGRPHIKQAAVTPRSQAGPEPRLRGANSGHHATMAVIGLALAAHLARDNRTYQHVIMAVIGLAAVAGLGKASQTRTFTRLAAWDKGRNLSGQRVAKTRRA
jgi:hypothetical protein